LDSFGAVSFASFSGNQNIAYFQHISPEKVMNETHFGSILLLYEEPFSALSKLFVIPFLNVSF
jgi:hypothetical protein